MPFTIPNVADASVANQAEPDRGDFDVLAAGFNGDGVLSGCAVTAQGSPDMTVAVASGTVQLAGVVVAVTGANGTITAAHATLNRFDLVTISGAGAIVVVAGTAAASPTFPTTADVVLAAVWVPAADTTIATNQITDKRVMLKTTDSKGIAVASAGTVTLGAGELFHITGTTTITDIDFAQTWNGRRAILIFDGILTLTHNATSLILPGSADIITDPGDSCWVMVDSGDNVKVVSYERATAAELHNPFNQSTAAQTFTAAATAYVVGSNVLTPPSGLRVGTRYYWRIGGITKTAAGTAAKSLLLKIGTAGTTGDATILTFSIPAGTAISTDLGYIEVFVTIRGPLGASCVAIGHSVGQHTVSGGITGLWNQLPPLILAPAASAGFTSSTANLIVGLAFTMGAAEVWTIQSVISDSENL